MPNLSSKFFVSILLVSLGFVAIAFVLILVASGNPTKTQADNIVSVSQVTLESIPTLMVTAEAPIIQAKPTQVDNSNIAQTLQTTPEVIYTQTPTTEPQIIQTQPSQTSTNDVSIVAQVTPEVSPTQTQSSQTGTSNATLAPQVTLVSVPTQTPVTETASVPSAGQNNQSTENMVLDVVEIVARGDVIVEMQDEIGNMAMLTEVGLAINQIPHVTYRPDNFESYILIHKPNQIYTVTIKFQREIPLWFRVANFAPYGDGSSSRKNSAALFMDVPTSSSGQATVVIDPSRSLESITMQMDTNGDGTIDYVLEPTSVLDEEAVQDLMPPSIDVKVEDISEEGKRIKLVTINAIDGGVGLYKVMYSLDSGQSLLPYSEPLRIEEPTLLWVHAVDFASNENFVTQEIVP